VTDVAKPGAAFGRCQDAATGGGFFVEAHKGQAVNVFAEHPLFVYGCGLLLPRDLQWKDFIDQSISFLEYSNVLARLEQKYKKGQAEWISMKKNY